MTTESTAASSEAADRDELVDVGGHRLHVNCTGSGSPTVVLEAGLGSSSRTWAQVMPEAAKFTRVCSYDRPGEGKSDSAPRLLRHFGSTTYIGLRSGQQIVGDLHTLLGKIKEAGPYVLVGHSFGGLCAILYADQYPTETVGMVLVDSAHPDQVARSEALMTSEQAKHHHDGLVQNEEGFDIDQILVQVRATHWHSDIPLSVLAHGRVDATPADWTPERWAKEEEVWQAMQAEHARRSPNGTLVIAEKSGHDIQNDQPELVIDAIKQVVNLARLKH